MSHYWKLVSVADSSAMSNLFRPRAGEEALMKRLQALIEGARENWIYAIYWLQHYDTTHTLVIGWGDGFFKETGEKATTTSLVEQEYRKKVLKDLSFLISQSNSSVDDCFTDQDEEVSDLEWFFLVSMTQSFIDDGGLPGQAISRSYPIWVAGPDRLAASSCQRARQAQVSGIKTMVCVPIENGVVELGSTDVIFQSSDVINEVRIIFDFNNLEVGSWPVAKIEYISKPIQFDKGASSRSSGSSTNVSSTCLPSSSRIQLKYDVFLSFRGPDTRRGIASDLYDRLQNKRGITTFMDNKDIQVGDVISPALLTAIDNSRFAIIVLSENYAQSAWCLEELAMICKCMEDNNRIFPLFYNVKPSDVRHRKRSFQEAFEKHESSERYTSEKVQQWTDALNKVAAYSGWDTENYQTDRELVDAIVDYVCKRIQPSETEFKMSTEEFEAYEATRKAMNHVMEALAYDKITAIGVYGMGGVGKTAMAKHAAAQSFRKGTFHHVILTVVSQSPNFERIQHTLLGQLLGPKFQFLESGRASSLYKEIMRKNKVLIILDDIWGCIDLSKVGIPSYDELKKCNSKVLLTSRRLHVCKSMNSQVNIPLHTLSEPDSWSLFVKKTKRSFDTPDFDNVARKIARECKGLPIALIAVARALGDKDLAEWQEAAQQLEKSQIANPDHVDDAFECIKLSYDYLKNEDYKSCFRLCCLFPEDSNIPIEDLFKYAIGNGLFGDTETICEARGRAYSVFKHLKDSSLLLDSKYGSEYVRMHDVVRDTAIRIAKFEDGYGLLVKAGCGLKKLSCRSYEGYSAISLMENQIRSLPEELVGPKLHILLLQDNTDLNEIAETFFPSQNNLRVLDLSRTNISLLPQSLSLLTRLQALYLDFCLKAIDISILGQLKKLEILSMRQYPLKKLSRKIRHLTNLKMLDVGGCSFEGGGIVTIPSEVISKLHRLEELYMMYCGFKNWGNPIRRRGAETNIGFGELAGLPNLENLQVSIFNAECIPKNVEVKPSWFYFDIRIGRCTSDASYQFDRASRSLVFRDITISTLPDWFIDAVAKKTEKLQYRRCKGMSDIVMEYDKCKLLALKHLTVRGYSLDSYMYLKVLMNTKRRVQKGPVFEKLEELHLMDLIHLEELFVGELPPRSLSNLKVMHVYCCGMLKNVSTFIQRLPNLKKLYLNWMDELNYVFGCEGFEPKQSKLIEVILLDLSALRSICNGPAPRAMFQSLESLTIYRCRLLQSVFPSDVANFLVQLKDLFVEQCLLLETIFDAPWDNEERPVLPKLKNLVMRKLPKLYLASAIVDMTCPSLEHLIVMECPQLLVPASTYSSVSQFYISSLSLDTASYYGSTNPVQVNDPQMYQFLHGRCHHVTPFYATSDEV